MNQTPAEYAKSFPDLPSLKVAMNSFYSHYERTGKEELLDMFNALSAEYADRAYAAAPEGEDGDDLDFEGVVIPTFSNAQLLELAKDDFAVATSKLRSAHVFYGMFSEEQVFAREENYKRLGNEVARLTALVQNGGI